MSPRSEYTGKSRKLVLAFDVGTTYSGASFCILDPGHVPEIKGVTRFPSQELVGGDSKIPTILYYDKAGAVRAVGAEAAFEGIEHKVEEEGWVKAEWFKLHLRPKLKSGTNITNLIPPLPLGKTIVQVFADFLRYLYDCTEKYIQESYMNDELWSSLEPTLELVLSHPNGWEGGQQRQMRDSAVLAGIIPDTESGQARISFVTEGEASLHYCIENGLDTSPMMKGDGVLIVDAGGGTIDLSAYGRDLNVQDLSFEEICAAQCHFQGSIFVTQRARTFLEGLLRGSNFAQDVNNITTCFDKTTKLRFRDINEPQYIKFGSARDRDPLLNIRSGQLKIAGTDVASFFGPSIECIIEAILEQTKLASKKITSVFMVGGFAASDWLFSKIKQSLEPVGLKVSRPDSHVNKAVADGAISFYLNGFVASRVSKHTYGAFCITEFNYDDPEHVARKKTAYVGLSGTKLPGYFSIILNKGIQVSKTREFRRYFSRDSQNISSLFYVSESIICYRGKNENPKWRDTDPEMFTVLCTVEADTTRIAEKLKHRRGPGKGSKRSTFWRLEYSILLSFGLTELKAQICWIEDGIERRSPARLVYDIYGD